MSERMLEAALKYALQGWAVLPCRPGEKVPLGKLVPHGVLNATTDPEVIRAWWSTEPDANIGIATGRVSGLLVADFDGDDGTALWEEHRPDEHTLCQKTPHGHHALYIWPEDLSPKCSVQLLPGLDIRADGGYIVVAPSVLHDGKDYSWLNDVDPCPGERGEEPGWLREPLARARPMGGTQLPHDAPGAPARTDGTPGTSAYAEAALRNECGAVRQTPEGGRNYQLNRSAYNIGGLDGLDPARVQAELLAAALDAGLGEEEATKTIASGMAAAPHREAPHGGDGLPLTELALGEAFAARHGKECCWVPQWGAWAVYMPSEGRWTADPDGAVPRRMGALVRSLAHQAMDLPDSDTRKNILGFLRRAEGLRVAEHAIGWARTCEGMTVQATDFDKDPFALNCQNGVINLQTGEVLPHSPEALHSKLAPVVFDPAAEAPRWEAFLERILPAPEVRAFVQRAAGYSATGSTSERVLLVLHGAGRNGKSTFLRAMLDTLGDYAGQVTADAIVGDTPDERACVEFVGLRVACASETGDGRRLRESVVKSIAGGSDKLRARRLYGESWEFVPTATMWLGTNHKPKCDGGDAALWDRIRLVPFTERIDNNELDPDLPDALRRELPGILRWIVEGCSAWQARGLNPPTEVLVATTDYQREEDQVAQFLEECYVADAEERVTKFFLYKKFREWQDEQGEKPATSNWLGRRITDMGYMTVRGTGGVKHWLGLRARSPSDRSPSGRSPLDAPAPEGQVTDSDQVTDLSGNTKSISCARVGGLLPIDSKIGHLVTQNPSDYASDSVAFTKKRRNVDTGEQKRNISDGLRAEEQFAALLDSMQISYSQPPKKTTSPDGGADFVVNGLPVDVKTSKMGRAVVCAEQLERMAGDTVIVFYHQQGDQHILLGSARAAWVQLAGIRIPEGDPIPETPWTAHYPLIVIQTDQLLPVEELIFQEANHDEQN